MVDAIIFDLDGTLVNSEPVRKRTELQALQEQGIDLDREQIDAYTGIPLEEWFPMLKDDYDLDMDPAQAQQDATRLYLEHLDEVPMQPDAMDTVSWVAETYKVAIGTSSQRLVAEQVLTSKGLDTYIQTLVTADDVANGKPESDIFEEAARQLDVHPSKTIVVEDSPHGIEAANTGGFISIGFQDNAEQDLSAADHVVDSMKELQDVIERIDEQD